MPVISALGRGRKNSVGLKPAWSTCEFVIHSESLSQRKTKTNLKIEGSEWGREKHLENG